MSDLPTPLDISSELVRIYTYGEGVTFAIPDPSELYITQSGSHRVVDKGGMTHRPTPGWIAISWTSAKDAPPFVA